MVLMLLKIVLKWLFLHLRLITTIVEEFLPNLTGWPVIVFSLIFSVYWYGHSRGIDSCEESHRAADLKMEKKNGKIKEHNDSIGGDKLNRGLQPYYRD